MNLNDFRKAHDAKNDLLDRTAGHELTRDERRLLKRYDAQLASHFESLPELPDRFAGYPVDFLKE